MRLRAERTCYERFSRPQQAELVTPTGALLITGFAEAFGPVPRMRLRWS